MNINYRDFYQKSLIIMGEKDSKLLKTLPMNKIEKKCMTHWLIALEGEPKDDSEKYEWCVSVYPATFNGTFNWKIKAFSSNQFNCIHTAFDFSKEVDQFCKSDSLTNSLIVPKLNDQLIEKEA